MAITLKLNNVEPHRPVNGICTDGAHSVKRGVTEYRGIDLATGKELFYKELGNNTANVGEFLGVVAAVKFILETNYAPPIIYTDSITAITWFSNKKTASRKRLPILMCAEVFLKVMASKINSIQVRHWNTLEWGEIPADFQNK